MKKLTAIFMCVLLVCGLAACGSKNDNSRTTATPTTAENTTAAAKETESVSLAGTEAETGTLAESQKETEAETLEIAGETDEAAGTAQGKTLVVYYSASGNTERVAQAIASATGGDTFKLEPAEPYSSDDLNWRDEGSRVVREHDNPDERAVELVESTVPDWESYDTIFIGYPIWWGIAAWPVDGFIAANDFTGKTVIPFCTSSSSGLGESGSLLEQAAGTGDWMEGQRFSSGVSEEEVKNWVDGLGL